MLIPRQPRTAFPSHWTLCRHTLTWAILPILFTLSCLPHLFGADLTVQKLREDPDLTPALFMTHFRDFSFKLSDKLQDPDVFLATRKGDCDDFAALAESLLREKKFTTTLVAVFMHGQTHVVRYVQEVNAYLDFNLRGIDDPLQPSSGQLEDIAEKVATYFRSAWHSVAEYKLQSGTPRFGSIAFR